MTYLLKINGTTITNIKRYSVSLPKLNAKADRNMRGNLQISPLGIFPKISVDFKPMTEDELADIASLLNSPSFTLEWWNPVSQSYKTGTFYSGDTDFSLLIKDRGIYDSFKVSFVSFDAMP